MVTETCATAREIEAQPAIWCGWSAELERIVPAIRDWIRARAPQEIWLCGAGTSAFIGDALAVSLRRAGLGLPVRAIATTDLVARPSDFCHPGLRPLVVSFGRSGNSSESIGTLDILDRLCPEADRLNITCNKASTLATRAPKGSGEQRVIVLPDACHDRGFAMTSSYTTMLLTALACLSGEAPEGIGARIGRLAGAAEALLAADLTLPRPERAIFLGSGPFTGTARESALKVLELTAGQVVTSWDSSLGFRHGPKAITTDRSAVVVYLSGDRLTRRYDDDIVAEIRAQFPGASVLSVGARLPGAAEPDVVLDGTGEDVWDTALAVIVAQRLAVDWSASLGLAVDDPFGGRNLTRVVSHVRLYE